MALSSISFFFTMPMPIVQSGSKSALTGLLWPHLLQIIITVTIVFPGDGPELHGPSMFAVKAKIYGLSYNKSSSIAFDETSSYWSAPNAPNFSAFHFGATRVVHLPKRTETSLVTESDQRGPNHQLLQLCTAHSPWSDCAGRA